MKKYLISFYWEDDVNSEIAVSIRKKIEKLSPKTWIQIFPNLLVIQSDRSMEDIYSEIKTASSSKRFIITEVSEIVTNEDRSNSLLNEYGY
ncbi:hypothetical protein [Sediminibacillus massiliensis]|uniref:hypothetical protein n=1 Tax=Sediminibacillus massiliensis TaxID=1926277 RepID=UPI001178675F|nr:hypothetical protein [Sediminibacillus massiliensis]